MKEKVVDPRSVIKVEEDVFDFNDMVLVQNLHEGIWKLSNANHPTDVHCRNIDS